MSSEKLNEIIGSLIESRDATTVVSNKWWVSFRSGIMLERLSGICLDAMHSQGKAPLFTEERFFLKYQDNLSGGPESSPVTVFREWFHDKDNHTQIGQMNILITLDKVLNKLEEMVKKDPVEQLDMIRKLGLVGWEMIKLMEMELIIHRSKIHMENVDATYVFPNPGIIQY